MINVLHVITTIEKGGAENQLLILVEAQIQKGMQVIVLPLKGQDELSSKFEQVGAFVDLSFMNKLFINQIVLFRLKYGRYNGIIHAHLPKSELLVAFAAKYNRTVFSRHNAEQFFSKAPAIFSRMLSKLVSNKLRNGIAISNAVLNFCMQNSEISSKATMKVVSYGFPFEKYRNLRHHSNEYDFGTVARLVPQKDIETLLDAFALLTEKSDNLKLVVIGDGEQQKKLFDYAEKLKLNKSINWAGRQENIVQRISEMKIFVLTSIYEGLGLVLLEAIAANTPILAANNTAIPEVLGINYPGLFETGDAKELAVLMEKSMQSDFTALLISEYESRRKLFTVDKMIDEIVLVYKSAFASGGTK